MDKQNIRLILLFAIFFVAMYLFNSWQQEHAIKKERQQTIATQTELPAVPVPTTSPTTTKEAPLAITKSNANLIEVKTDVLNLKINPVGGDLVHLSLPMYPQTIEDPTQGFVLLEEGEDRYYVMQTGLLNDLGPDSSASGRVLYTFDSKNVVMTDDESILNVDLKYATKSGVKITKRFIFERGSYVIRQHFIIENNGKQNYQANMFGRIKRNEPKKHSSGWFGGAMRTYTGAAINTPEKKYEKITFAQMQDKPYKQDVLGGWEAMVEHYFATAIVPAKDEKNSYQSENFGNNIYAVRFVGATETIAPGASKTLELKLYAGPEIAENLKAVAPGLNLTIDYGMLWFLCQPIFWLLKKMHEIFSNWGVAIIATTVLIKALFYRLSAASYKSMGNLRKLQPKIEALKQRCGDDKQRFSQELMGLYKKEKVNPLGGCLPILVQIPVFIALYYVLLESVELRQAPFMLWIHDLSAKDPYYVLPIIMGASMFAQQRLNPAPADPVQAKVMMFMPIFFTFLFLQFPAGLVLYWVVNNLLSMLQQWLIVRKIEKTAT